MRLLGSFRMGKQTVVSCSSRTEHCRPASSSLCGFQATEFALHAYTHTLTDILHNAFAIFLKCILPPFYAFQQMSVFLGKEHTPSPGSLKKIVCHKFNRNFIDSVTQTSFPMMSRIKQKDCIVVCNVCL